MRRLVVLRHAKAEAHAASDHARHLTPSGLRAASSVGRWFAAEGIEPDYALVSSATRTRETWACVASELSGHALVEVSDGLYLADPESVIDAIRWVPVDSRVVIVIGHNPTAGELPHLLDDGSGPRELLENIHYGFPTAAAAIFDVPSVWSELGPGRCRLTDLFVGDRT